MQRTAEGDVDELRAAANAEDRLARAEKAPEQRKLVFVPRLVDVLCAGGVAPVKARVDVAAAREQQRVAAIRLAALDLRAERGECGGIVGKPQRGPAEEQPFYHRSTPPAYRICARRRSRRSAEREKRLATAEFLCHNSGAAPPRPIRTGIEVVITALTRNRITFMYPPNPGTLDFIGFSEGSKAKNQICSPHQFSPKSEVFFGGQM